MNSHNDVGIVTLVGRYNYGNRLQNYATQTIYQSLGFKAVTLDTFRPAYQEFAASCIRIIRGWSNSGESSLSPERLRSFDRFNALINLEAVPLCDKGLVDRFYFFSVGSDQVWNLDLMRHRARWFFLEFAEPSQRIALAPSIGLDAISTEQAKRIARGISGFCNISVREKRGADLIYQCSGRNAEVICDPTLVLPPKEWRAVADDRLTPEEPYVFTYLLGGAGESAGRILNEVTDHGRLPVVPLSDRQKPEEPDAGPAEFISLIDNAVHVVTDSFHAAVFSSILQTPLTIVRREGGASMFSRLEGLAEMLGIEHKVYGSPEFDLSRAGDYEGVPEAIEFERKKFMDYLEGCLDVQLPGWRSGAHA